MPNFGSFTVPPALYQGDSYFAWNNETPGVGAASQEAAIAVVANGAIANSLSVEIVFGAAPGVFEVDLETSDTDVDSDFVKLASIAAVTANNVARLEQTPAAANFARLHIISLANAVSVTAKVTSH